MNNQDEVFSIPCRKFPGQSGNVPACPPPASKACDNHPQSLGQHNQSNDVVAMPMPKLTTIELKALSQHCLAAEEGDREAQKELEYFSPLVLAGIINELVESRKQLRKVALTLQNDSQPDPIMPIGGGRYVDLSRVQDIEPKQQQVCLTLVSGAVAWAPIEMAGELISAWQAIRRAQVWGRAK